MNLRGSTLYDYADKDVTWTHNGTFVANTISEKTSWTYFIPKMTFFDTSDIVTRSSLMSTSRTNFTIMFRYYSTANQNPGMSGTTILFNGDAPLSPCPPIENGFWGFLFTGADSNSLQFNLIYVAGGNLGFFLISTEYIQENRWYHIAFTVSDNGNGTSTAIGYLNGSETNKVTNFSPLTAPSGSTKIGGPGQAQSFSLTDIVFLEKVLTSSEVAAYSLSAYI